MSQENVTSVPVEPTANPVAEPTPKVTSTSSPATSSPSTAPAKATNDLHLSQFLREDTTNLDPYHFDDELVPCSATCCVVYSCFLRTPDCYGGHGKDSCVCINQEFSCLKPGRNPEEFCVL